MSSEPITILKSAESLLSRREFEAVIPLAEILIAAGEPWALGGLQLRATAFENWVAGPADRLVRASQDWRRVIDLAPASVAYQNLARVLIKNGDHQDAFEFLVKASSRHQTPELLLGFAEYYRRKSPPDPSTARSYFKRAALRGRAQGIRGYVEVSMEQGKPGSAMLMVLFGLVMLPVHAAVLRDRRHAEF